MENYLEPQVNGIRIYANPHVTAGGSKIIANFDLHFAGMLFLGCALVERAGGGYNAWPPGRAAMGHDNKSAVRFVHGETRTAITKAALTAYDALGGAPAKQPEELPAAVMAMLDHQHGERPQ